MNRRPVHSHSSSAPAHMRIDPSEKHMQHMHKSTIVDHTAEQLKKHNQRHSVRMEHLQGVNDNVVLPTTRFSKLPTTDSEIARKKLMFATVYE